MNPDIQDRARNSLKRETLVYFIEECLQLVLRAGGIDKFIYTPHNVFVCTSKLMGNKVELKPNWTSVVGHKILQKKEFLLDDFMEIYPVLETSLLKEGFTN